MQGCGIGQQGFKQISPLPHSLDYSDSAPSIEVKEFTRELRRLGVSMNQIAAKAHSLGFVDDLEYRRCADEVMKVLGAIQQEYAKKGVKLIGNN